MEFVTLDHIDRVTKFSPEDGKPLFPKEKDRLGIQFVWLYDPPVEGVTPLDGAGEPRASVIRASQLKEALAKGFTEAPLKKGKK